MNREQYVVLTLYDVIVTLRNISDVRKSFELAYFARSCCVGALVGGTRDKAASAVDGNNTTSFRIEGGARSKGGSQIIVESSRYLIGAVYILDQNSALPMTVCYFGVIIP